ncbi:MAG: hypothetical protein VKJ24_03075 [Synechococcales bacterium]|nr:hypothetical protein [Synechococcales bacterium]
MLSDLLTLKGRWLWAMSVGIGYIQTQILRNFFFLIDVLAHGDQDSRTLFMIINLRTSMIPGLIVGLVMGCVTMGSPPRWRWVMLVGLGWSASWGLGYWVINELSALAPTNELPIPETFLSEDLQIILAYSLTFGFVSSLIIGIGFLTCFPQSLKLRDRPSQEDT